MQLTSEHEYSHGFNVSVETSDTEISKSILGNAACEKPNESHILSSSSEAGKSTDKRINQFASTDLCYKNSDDAALSTVEDSLLKVEKSLEEDNYKEESKLLSKQDSVKELDSEERHKRLMNLLKKSQFYANFVLKRVTEQKDLKRNELEKENNKANANNGRKRKGKNTKTVTKKRKLNDYSQQSIDLGCVHKSEDSIESFFPSYKTVGTAPKLFEKGEMRPYQLEGYHWLKVMFENGVNGILADEMGLGKTIQSISLVCHLIEMGVCGPFLIVAPLSTLSNWISEFNRFAPKISALIYHGTIEVRKEKRESFTNPTKILDREMLPVVITSYEVVIKDKKYLSQVPWSYIIIDEGHRLKNHNCQLTRTMHMFSNGNRLILTGTPLQNNLAELWSLLNFILPEIFDSLDVFESWFNITDMMQDSKNEKIIKQEREKQIVSTLHQILQPFLLRRVKTDVDLQLPKKKEVLVYTPISQLQLELYRATLTKDMRLLRNEKEEEPIEYNLTGRPKRNAQKLTNLYAILNEDDDDDEALEKFIEATVVKEKPTKSKIIQTSESNIRMTNICMQLRKVVNHPYLLSYPLTKDGDYKVDNDLIKHSGKIQVLDQILKKLQKDGHKVLIFSQMTKVLNIIEDYLSLRPQFQYRRLDGSVNLDDRAQSIKEFNENKNIFLFLLSTRAGGLGINVTAADTVIIYDSDWNPQQDLQAQDRCHRIGQTRPVLVLRLCAENTIDQKIIERASTKRKLEKIILKSGKFKSKLVEKQNELVVNPEELLDLLQKSDHSKTCNKSSESVLSEKELEDILDRSDLL